MTLFRAASAVSLLTLASRITGLVREQLIAGVFGASAATDAFNVAFRIPNLLRRLFAEGAFSQAFVPLLAATRARDGDDATRRLIDAVATVLAWALALTSLVGVVAAPAIVWAMASGLAAFDDAVVMTRWMFPYIAFISLVALSAGVLNTWQRFSVPAVTPVLLNLAMIAGAAWGAPWMRSLGWPPIYGVAAGVMAGGLLQLGAQLPALRRIGALPRIGLAPARLASAWRHGGVRRMLALMAPAVLGVSVAQISLLVNTQIASHLRVGSVSWLTYADRLMEFPTALLGVALGVVLLPRLAAAQAKEDAPEYSALLDGALRIVVLLAAPCAVALLLFPLPLVAVLFHNGAFSAEDVAQTTRALRGYGVGLLGIVAVKVLAPGFYARQDIRTPVRIAIVVLAATQAMNAVFVPRLGHAGLALAIGLGATLNAGWLLAGLVRAGAYRPTPGWRRFALQLLAGNLALAAVLAAALASVDWIGLRDAPWQRAAWLAAALAAAAAIYFATLWIFGWRGGRFASRN